MATSGSAQLDRLVLVGLAARDSLISPRSQPPERLKLPRVALFFYSLPALFALLPPASCRFFYFSIRVFGALNETKLLNQLSTLLSRICLGYSRKTFASDFALLLVTTRR